jgi:hypothetical protein
MPALSGVIIVEAVKQVYAIASGKRVRRISPRARPALAPLPTTRRIKSDPWGQDCFSRPGPYE